VIERIKTYQKIVMV